MPVNQVPVILKDIFDFKLLLANFERLIINLNDVQISNDPLIIL